MGWRDVDTMKTPAILALIALLSFSVASSTQAQWDAKLGYGFTHRANDRPRQVATDPGFRIDAPGEATTVWARGDYWLDENVALEASATYMWDTSWSGGGAGSPPPDFRVSTFYFSPRLLVSPFPRSNSVGIEFAAGPALVLHGGNETSLLANQTNFGLSAGAALRVHLSGGLGVQLDGQLYWYSAEFVAFGADPASSETQTDVSLSIGLGWRW